MKCKAAFKLVLQLYGCLYLFSLALAVDKWVEEAEVWSKSSRDNSQQILEDLKCRWYVVNPAAVVALGLWPFPSQKGW